MGLQDIVPTCIFQTLLGTKMSSQPRCVGMVLRGGKSRQILDTWIIWDMIY